MLDSEALEQLVVLLVPLQVEGALSSSRSAPAMMETAPNRPGNLKPRRAAPKPPME
jgi:hypothetical protein